MKKKAEAGGKSRQKGWYTMKLRECKDWKAVHLNGRTILKSDCRYMSAVQLHELAETEVEPVKGRKGHYKAKKAE